MLPGLSDASKPKHKWDDLLTMSARWLSSRVKPCFPAEASRLCRSTSRTLCSHAALLWTISVWSRHTDSKPDTVPTQQAAAHGSQIQPGCHISWNVWLSTLPTLYLGRTKHFLEPGSLKAKLQTKSASWNGEKKKINNYSLTEITNHSFVTLTSTES